MATTTQIRQAIRAAAKSLALNNELQGSGWTDAPGHKVFNPKRYVAFKVNSLTSAKSIAKEANALLLISTGESNLIRATQSKLVPGCIPITCAYVRATAVADKPKYQIFFRKPNGTELEAVQWYNSSVTIKPFHYRGEAEEFMRGLVEARIPGWIRGEYFIKEIG